MFSQTKQAHGSHHSLCNMKWCITSKPGVYIQQLIGGLMKEKERRNQGWEINSAVVLVKTSIVDFWVDFLEFSFYT